MARLLAAYSILSLTLDPEGQVEMKIIEDSLLDEGLWRKKAYRGSVVDMDLGRSETVVVTVESSSIVSVWRLIFLGIWLVNVWNCEPE